MTTCIEVKNLSVYYGQTEALQNASFAIEQGDFVGVVGPNGGGKTTLIKSLLKLLPTASGSITLFGVSIDEYRQWDKIGYLPQNRSSINSLFPASVAEVVMLGLLSKKTFPRTVTQVDKGTVDIILQTLGILELKTKMLSELSGGQQQKVLLARALVANPDILIFDEPSTALDPESRESFFRLVKKLNKEDNITIILITHDIGYIKEYANKLVYIDKSIRYFGDSSKFYLDENMIHSSHEYHHHAT